jgi:hypothetical protein
MAAQHLTDSAPEAALRDDKDGDLAIVGRSRDDPADLDKRRTSQRNARWSRVHHGTVLLEFSMRSNIAAHGADAVHLHMVGSSRLHSITRCEVLTGPQQR